MPSYAPSLDFLPEMLDFIEAEAKAANIEGKELSRLKLAGEEVLVNIISYGFPSGEKTGKISLSCKKKGDVFLMEIADNGIPFDPIASAKEIDIQAPLEKRTYGGYGIFLTLKIMDKAEYRHEGGQNILSLFKSIRKG